MRTAVIGAGLGGLAAAFDLVGAGHEVVVFEAAQEVGGLAAGFRLPHWTWSVERFYHHIFASDSSILGLLREAGLDGGVVFERPTTVMYHQGKFYPFDSPLAALRFPGLGWGLDKLRFGLVGLYLRTTRSWQPLERVTAETWMRRWAGQRSWQRMWRPMMVGKFSETWAGQVPMAWLWARLHVRTAALGTYRGGFQAMADDLAGLLRERGVTIRLDSAVLRVAPAAAGGLDVTTARGSAERFDRCLVTVGPHLLARMAPELPGDYLEGLLRLKSLGALVMLLTLDRPLSPEGYYWYNLPKDEGFPFLALVEHTRFVPPERFGGDHIVYCGDYLPVEHEHFTLTREQLLERFLPALSRVNPSFHPSWVRDSFLFKASYAQPVPFLNHSRNIPAVATPIPGLYFASMSQVYPWDRGTNFAVEIGRRAAGLMTSS